MKFALLFLVIIFFTIINTELVDEWSDFKARYNKEYISSKEEKKRMRIFQANLDAIERHNELYEQGLASFEMAMNQYGDRSQEEFEKEMLGRTTANSSENEKYDNERMKRSAIHIPKNYINGAIRRNFMHYLKVLSRITTRASLILSSFKTRNSEPKSIDWNQLGAVTPSIDQGTCGSCWAFSTIGALEGRLYLKTGKLEALSVQQLVDCTQDAPFYNSGCGGGVLHTSFNYIHEIGGVASEKDYPYERKSSECRFDKKTARGTCKHYDVVSGHDGILDALKGGPVCVVLDARSIQFRFYKQGIYESNECTEDDINHAVLAVGFGEEKGTEYWLVKNSWGTTWGENGLFKINRRKSCGMNNYAVYPIV